MIMKKGGHIRNKEEIKFDKDFAILHWKRGYSIRDIAYMLNQEHISLGNPYEVSYGIVQRDIKDVVENTKKLEAESGISALQDLISKSEYIYNEACLQQRATNSPVFMNIASKQIDQLAKLKGLITDKSELQLS